VLKERSGSLELQSHTEAHYADRGSILRVVEPVLMAPLGDAGPEQ